MKKVYTISLNRRFSVTLLLFFWGITANGQFKDTVLSSILTKPYFYNVIKGSDNKIYAGTSNGIIELDYTTMHQYGKSIGYIKGDKNGNPVIDSTGIRFYTEKTFSHLLPYPEAPREEYHAVNGKLLYLCSGGKLYIFDIVDYEYSYPNHSFRSISGDLLGTYSGIFLHGKKLPLPAPPYSDGYIRQFGDRAFICNYNIAVLEKDALESGKIESGRNFNVHYDNNNEFYNDIFPSPDSIHYFIASNLKLFYTDLNFNKDSVIFIHPNKNSSIIFITEDGNNLYFTSNNELYAFNYKKKNINKIASVKEKILGGVYYNFQVYFLTQKALYRYNSNKEVEKILESEQIHSILRISGSDFVISSDNGLFLFNLSSRALQPIIKGVEFNRQALFQKDGRIYAGSVNGLYTIQIKDIPSLVESNKAEIVNKSFTNNIILVILIAALILIALLIVILNFWKKLKYAKHKIEDLQTPRETMSREKIEDFISSNLPNASIKTLMDHFKVSAPLIYDALKPDRPGSIIQQLRLKTVIQMRKDNKSIEEISETTGLSVSYLKKLKSE